MAEGRGSVRIMTLGCRVNQADSERIAEMSGARGGEGALGTCAEEEARSPDDTEPSAVLGHPPCAAAARAHEGSHGPAVVVLNTCTVTAEADRKARKAIRHALSLPSRPAVIVTGCLAAVDPAAAMALDERVHAEADKERVATRVAELLAHVPGSGLAQTGPQGPAPGIRHRARVQVKVQDGCDARCTYCVVPAARGAPRSVPLRDVLDQVLCLAEAGVGEVVLTGVNIGRYQDAGTRLPQLLSAVGATGIPRVRLSSIEPGDVDEDLLGVASGLPSFCRHLHVPLQSGCDRTLAAMRRPYDTDAYAGVLATARAALPGLAVTTDVIAGFPGESEEDAAAALAFVERAGFSRLHVFRYSERPGTPASACPDQVRPAIRSSRARALRECGERLAESFAHDRLGTTCELLVERQVEREGRLQVEGTTREYLHAIAEASGAQPGDRVEIEITGVDPTGRVTARPVRA